MTVDGFAEEKQIMIKRLSLDIQVVVEAMYPGDEIYSDGSEE